MTKLTPDQIKKITDVKNILKVAQTYTGVPWQAIAAVWYRESFSIVSPKTPGGPFQFDPMPSALVLEGLLKTFTPTTPEGIQGCINKFLYKTGFENFAASALIAACWLRHNSKYPLDKDHSDEALKDAFYGYNGRAWGPHPESSPYVYNNFDLQHMNMTIRGSIPDPNNKFGHRKWVDITDKRPGAFTVYRQLIDEKV